MAKVPAAYVEKLFASMATSFSNRLRNCHPRSLQCLTRPDKELSDTGCLSRSNNVACTRAQQHNWNIVMSTCWWHWCERYLFCSLNFQRHADEEICLESSFIVSAQSLKASNTFSNCLSYSQQKHQYSTVHKLHERNCVFTDKPSTW